MKKILVFLVSLVVLVSCVDQAEQDNTPSGNFEALWQIMDEHYCFFDYKQHAYGLDWNEVYNKYKVRVSDKMKEDQLFEVLCDMLSELRDGHVNLVYSMDYGRYWAWQEDYPKNFSDSLERRYLGLRIVPKPYWRGQSGRRAVILGTLSRTDYRHSQQWRRRTDYCRTISSPLCAREDAGGIYAA